MFRWISLIGFAGVFAAVVLHHLVFPCGYRPRFAVRSLVRKKVHLLTLLFVPQAMGWAGRIRKLAFLLGLLCFGVLLATGFGPLLFGSRLQGWLLMVHATFAPVFIGCIAVVIFLGAARYRFRKEDARFFPCSCRQADRAAGCRLTDSGLGAKAGFWFLAVMVLPVTLTMVLSMLPWLGTDGQAFCLQAHRWCALVFSLAAIVQVYMLVRMDVLRDTRD
ncbi:MAG: hypothetical protein L0Y36_07345 [Planctomycetales bacterium]|nr:hypothetical protein [Planctomycetales bacterium]